MSRSTVKIQPIKKRIRVDGVLTIQQQLFVEYLIADKAFNAKNAAMQAGYGPNAHGRLLSLPRIAKILGRAIAERIERTKIQSDRVLLELARIGFADPRKLFDGQGNLLPIHEMPDEIAAAISSIDIDVETVTDEGGKETTVTTAKIRLWNKISALELMAKHLGMLNDKLNSSRNDDTGARALITTLLSQVEDKGKEVVNAGYIEDRANVTDE